MSLFLSIRDDILNHGIPLPTVLRKALILSDTIENTDLERWAQHELNGYPDRYDLPDYQIINCMVNADLSMWGGILRNHLVNLTSAPKEVQDELLHVRLTSGIGELQGMLNSDERYLKVGMTSGALDNVVIYLVPQGYGLISYWQTFGVHQREQVIDSVRNHLLIFLRELRKMNPDIKDSDDAFAQIPPAKTAAAVTTHIYGGNNDLCWTPLSRQ